MEACLFGDCLTKIYWGIWAVLTGRCMLLEVISLIYKSLGDVYVILEAQFRNPFKD